MKHIGTILTAMMVTAMSLTSSIANTISSDDATKVLALSKKAGDMDRDLIEVGTSIFKSLPPGAFDTPGNEGRRAYYCIGQLQIQAAVLERNLYGTMVATEMSSSLSNIFDEKLTLEVVRITLSTTSDLLANHRSVANAMMGGCARNSQLLYDKAKAFAGLIEEASRLINPTLRRVEKAIKEI